MGKFHLAVSAAALTLAAVAAPAFAEVSSAADCEYEGGEVFNVQGATVCLVQIRPEEYRDNEAYDGQQLGVNQCNGKTINDGIFCKITLVPAPPKPAVEEPVIAEPVELSDVPGEVKATVVDTIEDAVNN